MMRKRCSIRGEIESFALVLAMIIQFFRSVVVTRVAPMLDRTLWLFGPKVVIVGRSQDASTLVSRGLRLIPSSRFSQEASKDRLRLDKYQ